MKSMISIFLIGMIAGAAGLVYIFKKAGATGIEWYVPGGFRPPGKNKYINI